MRPDIMHPNAPISQQKTEPESQGKNRVWRALNSKIWLPKTLYASLPLLYIGLGIYAIAAALFLSHWSWIVPYFLIIGIICLHTGMLVATMRWRSRKKRRPSHPRTTASPG